MKQYNDSNGRKSWDKAREKARLKARFAIRQRVAANASKANHVVDSEYLSDNEDLEVSISAEEDSTRIKEIIQRMMGNDRAYFSLAHMEENSRLYASPFAISILYDMEHASQIFCREKLVSWYREEGFLRLEEKVFSNLQSITLLEVAILFRRWSVATSLLLGGADPCRRGLQLNEEDSSKWTQILHDLGSRILQKFFSSIPLTLQVYLLKRNFEFRQNARSWATDQNAKEGSCALCNNHVPTSFLLLMDMKCNHMICEPCFWKDILAHLDSRESDIVVCPACESQNAPLGHDQTERETAPANNEKQIRFQVSRDKYFALPRTSLELKKSRKKPKKRPWMLATWAEAASLSVGNSQDVRSDKFFTFIERGSMHFLRACVCAGVDLSVKNEYGQTGLYLAAFKGHDDIVALLLSYGSDPLEAANDGSIALHAATEAKHDHIVQLLLPFGNTVAVPPFPPTRVQECDSSSIQVTTLIPLDSEYAGAGSFIIDNILTESDLHFLLELYNRLPSDCTPDKKTKQCSIRKYYCDIHSFVTYKILSALAHTESNYGWRGMVFPFMRFLCYGEPQSSLAPHVDLSRVDTKTGRRSTHSFLLYLTNVERGGQTTLLKELSDSGAGNVLHRVQVKESRLLLFPHVTAHAGEATIDTPKILIRGEVLLNFDSRIQAKAPDTA